MQTGAIARRCIVISTVLFYPTRLTLAAAQIMPLRLISQGYSKTEGSIKLPGTNLEGIDAKVVSKELCLVQGTRSRHSMLQMRALHR